MLIDDEVWAHISPEPGEGQMRWHVGLITEAVDLALFLFLFSLSFVLTQQTFFCVTDGSDKEVFSF